MAKMINCKVCGKRIASNSKRCPSCGAKKPLYKRVWFWILVVILGLGVGGGIASVDTESQPSSEVQVQIQDSAEKPVKKEKYIVVQEPEMIKDGFLHYVSGVIKNNTGKATNYCQITVSLYDADGNQIGTALDNIAGLDADGTWKYKAAVLESPENVASFKITEITGF